MRKCYLCKEGLNRSNSSIEHIIPNALGGSLKSRDLICRSCNSRMGSGEDAELAKQLNFIANMLDIKRDSGEPQPIEVKTKSKNERYRLLPGGKPEMIKPKINISDKADEKGQKEANIIARDIKQARSVLKGLQRKYNITNQDIEEILKGLEIEEKILKEYLTFNISFGGEKALRAVAKIILNFYIYSDGDIKWVEDFICKYLDKNYNILSRVTFMYLDYDIVKKHEDEVLHSILIIGDEEENILYGYIELFNTYRVLVLLNDSYQGLDLSFTYFFDVENREERNRKYKLKLSHKEIIEYLKIDDEFYKNNLEKLLIEMNKIMEIIYSRHYNNLINKIIKDAFKKMESKYPKEKNSYLTSEMISFLSNEISEKYVRYLLTIGRKNL